MSEDKKSHDDDLDLEMEVLDIDGVDDLEDDFEDDSLEENLADIDDLDSLDMDDDLDNDQDDRIAATPVAARSVDRETSVFLDDDDDDDDDQGITFSDDDYIEDDAAGSTKASEGSGRGVTGMIMSLVMLGGIGAGGYYVLNMPEVKKHVDVSSFMTVAKQTIGGGSVETPIEATLDTTQVLQSESFVLPNAADGMDMKDALPMPDVASVVDVSQYDMGAQQPEPAVDEVEEAVAVANVPSGHSQILDAEHVALPIYDAATMQTDFADPVFDGDDDAAQSDPRALPTNLVDLNRAITSPQLDGVPEEVTAPETAELQQDNIAATESLSLPIDVASGLKLIEAELPEPVGVALTESVIEPELEVAVADLDPIIAPVEQVVPVIEPVVVPEIVVTQPVVQKLPQVAPAPQPMEAMEIPTAEIATAVLAVEPAAISPKPKAKPEKAAEEAKQEFFELKPTVSYGNAQGALRKVDPIKEPGLKYFSVSKSSDTSGIESILVAAKRASKLQRHDAALSFYNDLYLKNKRDLRILLGRAVSLHKLGRDEAAAKAYEELLRIEPNNTDAVVNMLGLIRKKNPSAALANLIDLKNKFPSNESVLAQIGLVHADLQNYNDALRSLGMAHGINPQNAQHPFNMAIIAERMKKPELAITYYEKALETDAVYGSGKKLSRDIIYKRLHKLRSR